MTAQSDVGVIGLAVMGQNLALNMADHGFRVSAFNRTVTSMSTFVEAHRDTPGGLVGCETIEHFVASLKRPRKMVVLVKAGEATDAVITSLVPLLESGDIIVDGGNARWTDTIRRERSLADKGIRLIGSGVSGGEEGARFGPSLMPGGALDAYREIEPIWKAIAAKVDSTTGKPLEGALPGKPIMGGVPCTAYMGPDGAGHFVKMVHNGIEYGDMQMIAESYDLLRRLVQLTPEEIGGVFERWNRGVLDSFLIEITADILRQKDPITHKPFVDIVLDAAGQKGTGKWTSQEALEIGVPAPTIAEAVFARCISAVRDERVEAVKVLPKAPDPQPKVDRERFVAAIHDALYCAKICSYAQGFQLMRAAQTDSHWQLAFDSIARIWRGGCIIRARFLQKITEAWEHDPALTNLLLDPYFRNEIGRCQSNWRQVVSVASLAGVPVPTLSSALAYYDGYRADRLPANLIQAQRDYFGAHTYERTDAPRGQFFHLDWATAERPQHKISK